jgi:hypothetical protein
MTNGPVPGYQDLQGFIYRYERFGFGSVQISCFEIKYISITKPNTYQLGKVMVLQDTPRGDSVTPPERRFMVVRICLTPFSMNSPGTETGWRALPTVARKRRWPSRRMQRKSRVLYANEDFIYMIQRFPVNSSAGSTHKVLLTQRPRPLRLH